MVYYVYILCSQGNGILYVGLIERHKPLWIYLYQSLQGLDPRLRV